MTDLQRGFVPIELDRLRELRFDLKATWLLVQRFGDDFLSQLYEKAPGKVFGIQLRDPDVMAVFLLVGLSAEAKEHGEDLTLEQVQFLVPPVKFNRVFTALVMALTGTHALPSGKAGAAGVRVEDPAGAKPTPPDSTSGKRKAGLPPRSASRRRSSGR